MTNSVLNTEHDTQSAQDNFNRSAGLKLLWYAFLAVIGLVVLMILLSWGSRLLGATSESSPGIDATNNTISLILSQEPPQLDSTLATDMVSGMVLGHIMEGLLRYDVEYQSRGRELNGKIYAISHRITNRADASLHIIGYRDPAEVIDEGLVRDYEAARMELAKHSIMMVDPMDWSDEGDARWLGRSFVLNQLPDPQTGLPSDELRVHRDDGSIYTLSLPGEPCGSPGRFVTT